MNNEMRVQQLLDELLDSDRTPEDICDTCPELLPAVRMRWQQIRGIDAELNALFPQEESDTCAGGPAPLNQGKELPSIPGYAVEAVLGRGGMGVVYKARHLRLNRPVALKMLLAGPYAGPHELARFQREAEAVAALKHPNIVQIYDVGDLDGRPYFTMELIEGGSLAQALAGTPQPARQAAGLVATLAGAMQSAHEAGIVHRDLKPSNVLFASDGTPKITDFGLARRFEGEAAITLSGVWVGTPSYMAPEQAIGKSSAIGPAADVYALGAILYEMQTGRPPFRAETAAETQRQVIEEEPARPSKLNARVPRDIETICLKCLQKDPRRRYGTAIELAQDLQRYLRGEPIVARRIGTLERASKWVRRHPATAAWILGALLLTIALICGGWWLFAERTATRRAVEDDLREAAQWQKHSSWAEARSALERAKGRLGGGGNAELCRRLDQSCRDLELALRLDDIRMNRTGAVDGRFHTHFKWPQADQDYEALFREAGLEAVGGDPATLTALVEASNIKKALVAALDDWSLCTTNDARRGWLLEVVRRADPDPAGWRDRVRNPETWSDFTVLAQLAGEARVEEEPVEFLLGVGERLYSSGRDPTAFLKKVQQAHPSDMWANFWLGTALGKQNPAERVRYLQAAAALRPNEPAAMSSLACASQPTGKRTKQSTSCNEPSALPPLLPIFASIWVTLWRTRTSMRKRLMNIGGHSPSIPSLHPPTLISAGPFSRLAR